MNSNYGEFGGQFAAETLMGPLEELEAAYLDSKNDPGFQAELDQILGDFVGRKTPICRLNSLPDRHASIYLKREDLAHTGAHKINNALGQGLLAKRMGKKRIVAETGAGQHGVAAATACAMLGLKCQVYMGEIDAIRQKPNAQRMQLLGAELNLVSSGSKTLKDAINEAMRDWITNVKDTHYLIGSALGPYPFPAIVRDFQSVIGKEAKAQFTERVGKLPDVIIACVGGGSNAIGIFSAFLEDPVELVGVQAAGDGLNTKRHAAPLLKGEPGILHGTRTLVNQSDDGQIIEAHSLAPGLDYPGVGPEHAYLMTSKRASYCGIDDDAALHAFKYLAAKEGILPALESAHAVAKALEMASQLGPDKNILVNLSGRGDKDLATVIETLEKRGHHANNF